MLSRRGAAEKVLVGFSPGPVGLHLSVEDKGFTHYTVCELPSLFNLLLPLSDFPAFYFILFFLLWYYPTLFLVYCPTTGRGKEESIYQLTSWAFDLSSAVQII